MKFKIEHHLASQYVVLVCNKYLIESFDGGTEWKLVTDEFVRNNIVKKNWT
jgi:hypothetical protein